jgi:hypothetical protein
MVSAHYETDFPVSMDDASAKIVVQKLEKTSDEVNILHLEGYETTVPANPSATLASSNTSHTLPDAMAVALRHIL